MTSKVDRAALIEAAADMIEEAPPCDCSPRCREESAERILSVVLPLVAQAIEATADAIKPDRSYIAGLQDGYSRAAGLVRSLAEEGQQQ